MRPPSFVKTHSWSHLPLPCNTVIGGSPLSNVSQYSAPRSVATLPRTSSAPLFLSFSGNSLCPSLTSRTTPRCPPTFQLYRPCECFFSNAPPFPRFVLPLPLHFCFKKLFPRPSVSSFTKSFFYGPRQFPSLPFHAEASQSWRSTTLSVQAAPLFPEFWGRPPCPNASPGYRIFKSPL